MIKDVYPGSRIQIFSHPGRRSKKRSIPDPDQNSGNVRTKIRYPGSGMEEIRIQYLRSGIDISDHISESSVTIVWVIKTSILYQFVNTNQDL